MNITEALEKGKGKARLPESGEYYASRNDEELLIWRKAHNNQEYSRVMPYEQRRKDWVPYIETGKCRACKLKVPYEEQDDDFYSPAMIYLLNAACTCNKETK